MGFDGVVAGSLFCPGYFSKSILGLAGREFLVAPGIDRPAVDLPCSQPDAAALRVVFRVPVFYLERLVVARGVHSRFPLVWIPGGWQSHPSDSGDGHLRDSLFRPTGGNYLAMDAGRIVEARSPDRVAGPLVFRVSAKLALCEARLS